MKKFLFLFTSTLLSIFSIAQHGQLDPTFGDDGKATISIADRSNTVHSCSVLPNGKVVLGMLNRSSDNSLGMYVARLNEDGSQDMNFGQNGVWQWERGVDFLYDLITLPGGEIIGVGASEAREMVGSEEEYMSRMVVFKLKSDGTPSDNFGTNGVVTFNADLNLDYCSAVTIDSQGRIIGGGYSYFTHTYGIREVLFRLLPNGDLDTSFGTLGTGIVFLSTDDDRFGRVTSVTTDHQDRILAGGYYSSNGSSYAPILYRYTSAGTKDFSFGDLGSYEPFYSGRIQEVMYDRNNDNFYVCGHEELENSRYLNVRAFTNSASPLTSWADNGIYRYSIKDDGNAYDMDTLFDGNIIVAGGVKGQYFTTSLSPEDGSVDLLWGENGVALTNNGYSARSVSISEDGKVVVAGSGPGDAAGIARYTSLTNIRATPVKSTCSGVNDGSISVEMIAAEGPFSYSLDNSAFQDENVFEDLLPGNYTIYVKDGSAQTFVQENVEVSSPEPIQVTYNANETQLIVLANGGTAPYEYSLNGGEFQSSALFNNFNVGENDLTIRDANSCEHQQTLNVSLSIDEIDLTAAFEVYPNPAEEVVYVRSHNVEITQVLVFDNYGRRILEVQNFNDQPESINVSAWESGIYTLQIFSEYGKVSRRIMVK